jgi:hypothetical protein
MSLRAWCRGKHRHGDLVNMLERMGISTGVDVETLSRAALELARFAPEASTATWPGSSRERLHAAVRQ